MPPAQAEQAPKVQYTRLLAANAAFPLSFRTAASPLATTAASSGYCWASKGFSATAHCSASCAVHRPEESGALGQPHPAHRSVCAPCRPPRRSHCRPGAASCPPQARHCPACPAGGHGTAETLERVAHTSGCCLVYLRLQAQACTEGGPWSHDPGMRHSIQCRTSLASACQASAAAPGAPPSRFKVPVLRPERLTVLVLSTNSTSFAAATPATHCFTASLLARQVGYGLHSAYTSSQSRPDAAG